MVNCSYYTINLLTLNMYFFMLAPSTFLTCIIILIYFSFCHVVHFIIIFITVLYFFIYLINIFIILNVQPCENFILVIHSLYPQFSFRLHFLLVKDSIFHYIYSRDEFSLLCQKMCLFRLHFTFKIIFLKKKEYNSIVSWYPFFL